MEINEELEAMDDKMKELGIDTPAGLCINAMDVMTMLGMYRHEEKFD